MYFFYEYIYIYICIYIYIYIYEIHFIIYRSGVSLHSSQSQGSRFISLSSKSLRKPSMHRWQNFSFLYTRDRLRQEVVCNLLWTYVSDRRRLLHSLWCLKCHRYAKEVSGLEPIDTSCEILLNLVLYFYTDVMWIRRYPLVLH